LTGGSGSDVFVFIRGGEGDTVTDFENGVDVLARVSARFAGFSAHWVNSMRMHPHQQMTFIGREAVLKLTTPFNAGVFGEARVELRQGMMRRVERFPGVNHYVLQVENFGAHLRKGTAYPWTLEDAKGTQAMIDSVFAAAGRTTG